jgi:hypothetical protein
MTPCARSDRERPVRLREQEPPAPGSNPERKDRAQTGGADSSWLCCRTCGTPIAPSSARFQASGAPLVFANPHGVVFDIVTLSRADGARAIGPATSEFTWFAGYAWQAVLCGRCAAHLGWRYQAARAGLSPTEFFGLIRDELVERDTSS